MSDRLSLVSKNTLYYGVILGLLGTFLYVTSGILLPFMAGVLVAYTLNPLVTKVTNRGILGRSVVTSLLILLVFFVVVGALLVAIPFLSKELTHLAKFLPTYAKDLYKTVQPWLMTLQEKSSSQNLDTLNQSLHEHFSQVLSWGLQAIVRILTNTLAFANLLSLIVLTPVIAFYLLRDWPIMIKYIKNLLPRPYAPYMTGLFYEMNRVLGGYVRGQTVVCFILACYYVACLTFMGLKYSVTIGLITGFFAFIPYFGFFIGLCSGLAVALAQYDQWAMVMGVFGIFFIGQIIESYVLLPKLVGDRIGLHPVWIIFALLTGGFLFGFLGLLFAMPLAAMVGVLMRFGVQWYKQSFLYHGKKTRKIETKRVAKG